MARKIIKRSAAAGSRKGAGGSKRKPTETTEDDLLTLVPDGMAAAFVSQRLHDKQLAIAGLAPPADWSGDMPEVPEDIATEDHESLSNLLAAFTNAHSTAMWHAAKALIESGFYDDIKEYLEAIALMESNQSNEPKRKAEAKTDESVVAAQALYRSANSDYIRFRELANTLSNRWKTVSRVGGFVGDDTEGASATVSRSSTRGKAAGTSRGTAKGGTKRMVSRRGK